MVIHVPHAEGGFGVTSNDITQDAAFCTRTLYSILLRMLLFVLDITQDAAFCTRTLSGH